MEFETRRLSINKFIPEHINLMYEKWGCDEQTGMYLPKFDINWSIDEFSNYMLQLYKDDYLTRCIIQDKNSNEIVGELSLYLEDNKSKSINIIIFRDYWNKGYATEALKGLIKEIKKSDIESLYATSDDRNIAYKRVLEKCEFELIDTIPESRTDALGNLGDELLYELVIKKRSYNE